MAGDRETAEEILQDTLLALWKSAGTYQGRAQTRAWLLGIARRQAYYTLRRSALPRADAELLEGAASDEGEPEAMAVAAAERETLTAGLQQLPLIHREILILAFVHELSYQEIATLLEVPIGTVRSRLSNAKRALKKILERETQAASVPH